MFGVLVVGWPVIPKSPYPKSSTKERMKLGRSVGGLRPWVLGSSSTSANRRSHSGSNSGSFMPVLASPLSQCYVY